MHSFTYSACKQVWIDCRRFIGCKPFLRLPYYNSRCHSFSVPTETQLPSLQQSSFSLPHRDLLYIHLLYSMPISDQCALLVGLLLCRELSRVVESQLSLSQLCLIAFLLAPPPVAAGSLLLSLEDNTWNAKLKTAADVNSACACTASTVSLPLYSLFLACQTANSLGGLYMHASQSTVHGWTVNVCVHASGLLMFVCHSVTLFSIVFSPILI